MDSPLLTYVVLALGVLFGFFTQLVESQNPLPPSPPPLGSPPVSPPPPQPVSPLLPPSPRVPRHSPSPRAAPSPPKKRSHRPNSTQPSKSKTPGPNHRLHNDQTPSKEKLNSGKKIGLLFMGIGVMLQVCVVAFLMIRRRQLFKDQYMY